MPIPLRVLLVEDSDDDAALIVRLLRQGGYDVTSQRVDSEATIRAALNKKWDVIVSDFSMPHFSGTDALQLVRDMHMDTPFIFVSGTIGEEAAVRALKTGAQDYVMKSNLGRLLPAVQREMREADARLERRRMEVHINQLQRFESIGRLAGGVAHDFNNMIGAIMGWADMGMLETENDERAAERFRKIYAQSQRAAALTRQLLAFARQQMIQPKNTDLNEVVEESVSLLRSFIGPHIEIETNLDVSVLPAWTDPVQLEQVLMNLCLNARDALAGTGRLLIGTGNSAVPKDDARTEAAAGNYVWLSVADNGSGMDPETLGQIFEPFFTTKQTGKGTGLGLATVYGIVKQHKGFIEVDSAPRKGTTFRVYFPAGSGAPEAAVKNQNEVIARGKERILIAEDHEGVLESVVEILHTLGYESVVARDGNEVVEIYRKDPAAIDLILMDVVMPSMNGPAAYEAIRKINASVPVVFTTGYATEATLIHPSLQNQDTILAKPYGMKELSQKLRTMLDCRKPN